jgi:hypothetical protein
MEILFYPGINEDDRVYLHSFMVQMGGLNEFFIKMLAVTVLDYFSTRGSRWIDPVKFGKDEKPYDTAEKAIPFLREYVNWADHGYLNALYSFVTFLHHYAVMVNYSKLQPMERSTMALVKDALISVQAWKMLEIAAAKSAHGPHWGDATGWNQIDVSIPVKAWPDMIGRE